MTFHTIQDICKWLILSLISICFISAAPSLYAQPISSEAPVVFAGSLDDRSRVLFASYDRNFWLAYDTNLGQLCKIWLGSLAGPSLHAPSFLDDAPSVEGVELLNEEAELQWKIIRNGTISTPEVSYRGYRLRGNELILEYALDTVYGQRIIVEERPRPVSENNQSGINRVFRIFDAPENTQVGLDLKYTRLKERNDLQTDGYFHRFSEKKHSYYWGSAIDIEGRLILEGEQPTSITVFFSPNIIENSEESVQAASSPVAHLRPVGSLETAGEQPVLRRRSDHEVGISMRVYGIGEPIEELAELAPGQLPNINQVIPRIDLTQRDQFGGLDFYFVTRLSGFLNLAASGTYSFKVLADDGIRLVVADSILIEKNELQAAEPSEPVSIYLNAGVHSLEIDHFQSTGKKQLTILWQAPWMNEFEVLGAPVLSAKKEENRFSSTSRKYIKRPQMMDSLLAPRVTPEGKHPALTMESAPIDEVDGVVGGIGFLSNGRLVVTVWRGEGRVLILDGDLSEPDAVVAKEIATGLHFPLGLQVVDDEIFVLQNHELTHLIDNDANELIDEYRVVSNDWEVSSDYRELAIGLGYSGGYFYGALGMPIDGDGAILIEDVYQRGFLVQIGFDGSLEILGGGMQLPGGLTLNDNGQMAVSDQRNPWFSDSRVLLTSVANEHADVQQEEAETRFQDGSIWLPSDITTAPAQPFYVDEGFFQGQWFVGDMMQPILNRIYVDIVDEVPQGAVFPFANQLPCEIYRVVKGPENWFLSGGSAMQTQWGEVSEENCSFQKIVLNDESVFEMKSIRAIPGGFDVEFTEEPDPRNASDKNSMILYQWPNSETQRDRTKKRGTMRQLTIQSQELLEDGKTIRFMVDGLQPGHIVYLNVEESFTSKEGESLWSNEAWYSLNVIPR